MVGEWLTQTVDVPLWGVFALTAYSGRRLADAVGGLRRFRAASRQPTEQRKE